MTGDFRFKQFVLTQGQSAFKLGTDSVLLGCWVSAAHVKTVLDIGTGTGILSLMLAQRYPVIHITAIELDDASVDDCANNFALSTWKERFALIHQNVMDWSNQHKDEKFDLIITNPPYFSNSLKSENERKMNARHNTGLSHGKLAGLVCNHLSPEGCFACILPPNEFAVFTMQLLQQGLFLNHVLRVSSFHNSEVIRELGMFSFNEKELIEEEEFIYNSNHTRSEWYARISADFYVK